MKYQVCIIGGGLAGLALAIDLQKRAIQVLVIEKGNYPRHKVCGEYISMESFNYLHEICPNLIDWRLPHMSQFKLTSTGILEFKTTLDLGGFGISRHLLEELLFNEAKKQGVQFMLLTKALAVIVNENDYQVNTASGNFLADIVCIATGRKSNVKSKADKGLQQGTNYIGFKYHVKLKRDTNFIEIHNFPGGYCGVSGIEDDKTCICYIVNAQKLKRVNNSIAELEKTVLNQNQHLKKIFNAASFLFKEPLSISGINFNIKRPVEDDTFYLGDAAGCIAPVTGNGMSMALRSASVLANQLDTFFHQKISKAELIENYAEFWDHEFATRVKHSRYFQKLSEYPVFSNVSIGLFKTFPSLAGKAIGQTHGQPF